MNIVSKVNRQVQNAQPIDFDLSNCYKKISQRVRLAFDFDFTSSSSDAVVIDSVESIKLLNGGDWGDKGFNTGDIVEFTGDLEVQGGTVTWSSSSYIIDYIQGDIMFFTTEIYNSAVINVDGAIMPQQGFNSSLEIINTSRTKPQQIELFHNLIPNNSNHNNASLLDGEVNKFVIEDALSTPTFPATEPIIQDGNKSGGRYVLSECTASYVGIFGGEAVYYIDLVFFLLPYEFSSFDRPTWFVGQQCLKTTAETFAAPEINNPNSNLTGVSFNLLGNTGWLGENYNQGDNPFTIDNVSIQTSGGDALSEVDYNQLNVISATISGDDDFEDIIEVTFEVIPPEADFKNNEFSNLDNSYTSYFNLNNASPGSPSPEKFVFGKNGGEVDNLNQSVDISTSNEITIDFELNPNGDFANYINSLDEQDRRYRIVAVVQSVGGTKNDNNSVSLILKEGILTEAPIPDQPFDGVKEQGFYNHVQDIDTGVSEVNYNGRTEDDMVFKAIFDLDDNVQWERINLSVEVVKDSDETSFDLFSRTFNITGNPDAPMVGGVIQLNFEEQLNQFLDAPERNKISIKNTGNTGSGTYEVELIWSMLANWRYWLANSSAFQEFYDNTLPNNGKTQEWVRYLELAGYSLRARVRLIRDDIAYYFGGNVNILDYDDWAGETTHYFFDTDGNPITAIIQGQDILFRADHVLDSGSWDINDMWGHLDFRPKEADSRKQISTFWDWTAQNLPLKPKAGETKATLEIVTTNSTDDTARVECLLDGSLITDLNNTPVSRIQSPFAPLCSHPIDYVFNYIEANIVTDSDIVPVYNQLLNQGDATEKNICCPTCDKLYSSIFGDTTLFAIGSGTDISALITTSVATPNQVCCTNIYGQISDYPSCNEKYDSDINALLYIIDGDLGDIVFLKPSILNSYTGVTEMAKIKDRLEQLTSDEAIRYDLFKEMITRGIAMRCKDDGTKLLTRL